MYRYVWDREHSQSPPWQSRHVVQSRLSPESVGWSEGVMCKGESLEAAPAHRKSKVSSTVMMLLTKRYHVTFNIYNQIVFKDNGIKKPK